MNGVCEPEEPPPFRGGIVADPMGLGKTLTMIALAASDIDMAKPHPDGFYDHEVGKNYVDATLIIVPPPREYTQCSCLCSAWYRLYCLHVVITMLTSE